MDDWIRDVVVSTRGKVLIIVFNICSYYWLLADDQESEVLENWKRVAALKDAMDISGKNNGSGIALNKQSH